MAAPPTTSSPADKAASRPSRANAPTELRDLVATLPTPLAQLARRVVNARPGTEHHAAAFYFAESALKLAASARIAALLARPAIMDPALAAKLEAIVLPSIGHWWTFLAESNRVLRAQSGEGLPFAGSAGDLSEPLVRGSAMLELIEAAREATLVNDETARRAQKAGVIGFFEVLAVYRNQVMGHGALRSPSFYERFAGLLRRAITEVIASPAFLGGSDVAVPWIDDDPEAGPSSRWKVLRGLAGVVLDPGADGTGPRPPAPSRADASHVQLRFASETLSLHPFVVLEEDDLGRERFGFLNRAALGKQGAVRRVDYLDYATGEELKGIDATKAVASLLARIRGKEVSPEEIGALAATLAASPLAAGDEPLTALEARGDATHPSLVGRVLGGKYRLVGWLGTGGMATVYEGRHVDLERRSYAIKVLHRELAGHVDVVDRFRSEADEVSALRHPGIVDVTDFGREDDGTVFLVMEKLDGMPLDRFLDEVRPSIERVVRLISPALDALSVAHERGLVHRDLKPQNLFVSRGADGTERIKILDFGIAKVLHAEQPRTHDGMLLGTPRYMSPEQIRNPGAVDRRADIYSMGVTLYELLTGVPPVGGETPIEIIAKVSAGEIDRHPRERRPDVPPWLDALVARAMALDREGRFATALEMKEALESGLASGSDLARPLAVTTHAAVATTAPTPPVVTPPRVVAPRGRMIATAAIVVGAGALLGVWIMTRPPAVTPVRATEAPPAAPAPPMTNAWIEIAPPTKPLILGLASDASPSSTRGLRPSRHVMAPTTAYSMQAHEVTWSELDPWLLGNAGVKLAPQTSPSDPSARAKLPATGIPWEVASDYCHSIGGALPTEEQWEHAARGSEKRTFAWGSAPIDLLRTHAFAGKDGRVVPVMTSDQDVTPTGVHDLMGNAREWTATLWREDAPGSDEAWVADGPTTARAVRGWPLAADRPVTFTGVYSEYREWVCATGACSPMHRELKTKAPFPSEVPTVLSEIGFRCAR